MEHDDSTMIIKRDALVAAEVAEMLGVTRNYVTYLAKHKNLPVAKSGSALLIFSRPQVEQYMQNAKIKNDCIEDCMEQDDSAMVINRDALVAAEVAEMLGVTRQHVYYLVRFKKFPIAKSSSEFLLFSRPQVERYMQNAKIKNDCIEDCMEHDDSAMVIKQDALTAAEVAAMLDVTRQHVTYLARCNKLPIAKSGSGYLLFSRPQVERYMQKEKRRSDFKEDCIEDDDSTVVIKQDALTTAEVAEMLGVTRQYISSLVQHKKLPVAKSGSGYFLFSRPQVEQYMKNAKCESILVSEISKKLKACNATTLISINKIIDDLLEQQ